MANADDSQTRASLLLALRAGADADAWALFCQKYGPRIAGWCRKWGASEQDAEDVVQETLVVVFRKIADFQYRPELSFRGWLKTIARRVNRDVDDKAGRFLPGPGQADSVRAPAAENGANPVALAEYHSLLDHIASEELMELALDRARLQVDEMVWQCFERAERRHQPRKEVAALLGISDGYVRLNIHRVRELIERELEALDPK